VERGCLGGVFVVDSHWRLVVREYNRAAVVAALYYVAKPLGPP